MIHPFVKIKIEFDKIIDSIRNYKKEERKRQDLETIRNKKELAHLSRTVDQPEFAEFFEKEAKIIEDTKED